MNFEQELTAIQTEINQMFAAVVQNLGKAVDYYLNPDPKAEAPTIDDDRINAYERALESLCMQILLKETVYSNDFRRITASLKIIECLERVGDNAYDIAWMGKDIKALKDAAPLPGAEELFSRVEEMMNDAFKAYLSEDVKLSQEIMERDDEVDKLYWDMVVNLGKMANEGSISGTRAVYEAHVLKFFERVADQATNVAEWVVYQKTGYHKDRAII